MSNVTLNSFPTETRIAGLELLVQLVLTSLPKNQKEKLVIDALEIMKVIKMSPDDVRIDGLEDYLADVLERAISV